jgi:hypothetical protein
MATVDIKNKRIEGCKNNDELRHELNHIKYSESNIGQRYSYYGDLSLFYTIICIALGQFIKIFQYFSLIGVFLILFFFVFEEIWCNKK